MQVNQVGNPIGVPSRRSVIRMPTGASVTNDQISSVVIRIVGFGGCAFIESGC
jgi:hypothetical protein